MITKLEQLLKRNIKTINSQDTIYIGYLCDKIKEKMCKQYIKNESEDFKDGMEKLFLSEEYQDLVNSEHINDCNNIFF
ncbi:TPA: hypothetical protein LA460_000254 [Clostridium botulinum]|nr:hypothetical protein [Clostridium botulinum]HBJ1652858.1 hypothetical protein [Clostridium botulinum]